MFKLLKASLTTVVLATALASAQAPAASKWKDPEGCKSSILGICTSYFTEAEKADIRENMRLEAALRDPDSAFRELAQRLLQRVRFAGGMAQIQEPLAGSKTVPGTTSWSVDCQDPSTVPFSPIYARAKNIGKA
jgi:hypothetical protein